MKLGKQKLLQLYLLILGINLLTGDAAIASTVTYNLGDRLGDNLASYCHARWISYKRNIPFHYTPFKYSEHLAFTKMYPVRNADNLKEVMLFPQLLKRQINIHSLTIQKDPNFLYVVPFFPETRIDAINFGYTYFDVGWEDEAFLAQLREEIRPIIPLPTLELPKDRITVAVHLRKGSGPDGITYRLQDFPLRFPPDSFFIPQIKRVSEMFHNQPLYVYIFTDDKNPAALVERYRAAVNKPNIMFRCCQASHPNPEFHVLEDFFNLTLFDCIIRPESHFSQIASKLSRAKVIIHPSNYARTQKHKKKHGKKYKPNDDSAVTQVSTVIKK